ncbi:MAG: type I DNA topoisomerase, partial [Sulfurovum sp.]|nr:type I DNA topoisomerase [Sulfurovaceae bacterium]
HKRTTKTSPPFMTSTLQQSASTQLGFSPKKTMMIAQRLYEGVKINDGIMGIITYMRTDSLNIASDALISIREYIKKTYEDRYLPSKAKNYITKAKTAQEAHEAIRPTIIDFTPKVATDYLTGDELKLYKLIYNRFLTSQMVDAEFELQTILFQGHKTTFKASGRRLIFDGFYKVTGYGEKDKLLPILKKGQDISMNVIDSKQHFTEPPPRYNEASLIKKLESLGIGRPSTYAPTVTILQTRNYITIEKKRIEPTEVAFTVIDMLEKYFADIVDSSFTSNMEKRLDKVDEGTEDWQKVLKDFYNPFMKKIAYGKENIKSLKVAIPTGEDCPKCGNELLLRKGRYGEFIACSNFPKCKYTRNTDGTEPEQPEETDEICDKCNSPMVIKKSKRGKFLACSAYPKCKNAKPLTPPKELTIACPECKGKLLEKEDKKGKFFGCINYPKCKFRVNFEPVDKKCPECNYLMGKKILQEKDIFQCFKCKYQLDV